ncbi:hypothetical protein CXB51_010395 [Gossypium anomalum]|uniref:RNase H type-1 domain-containing protein n=1 Tax=Gossypium anomalum TaxID=47600 RepID=A0A8J5ZND6_9ROSI|nr:hypothetical protein CXB51_010395 [Gossypium anomalum]
MRRKLQNWKARKLSFVGRVTLTQSVLLAIHNYFMQTVLVPKGVCDKIKKITRQFIFRSSTGHFKNALVGWEPFCKPRSRGGLGLRHLSNQNISFLMKIAFNLISQKDALWVRVLRSKYGWKNHFSDSIHRTNCSHFWRSLSKVWPLLRENLIWSIGDGSSIRSWKDTWIPEFGPLLPYAAAHSSLNLECNLRDWVLPNGTWNLDLVRLWLPEDIIICIVSITPLHLDGGIDRIIWAHSAKQKLLTNAEQLRRRIGQSTKDVPGSFLTLFKFGFPLIFVVMISCRTRELLGRASLSSLSWAWHFEPYFTEAKSTASTHGVHHHLADNWVHLFADGAVTRDSGNAVAEGAIRDRSGNWILGFTDYLGRCSLLEVELWGILDGILVSLSKGYKKVRIQSDNLDVVKALSMEVSVDSSITVLRRVKRLMLSEGQWEIKYIPRECNIITDQLAKISLSWKPSLQLLEAPPDLVVSTIEQDQAFMTL